MKIPRRSFIRTSLFAAAALKSWPLSAQTPPTARVAGANSDLRIAVVGFNSRGADHLSSLAKIPGIRLAALCDVDSAVLEKEMKKAKDRGEAPVGYTDLRK